MGKNERLGSKTMDARDEFAMEDEYHNEVADMLDKADEVKQHLMDSCIVVKKRNGRYRCES